MGRMTMFTGFKGFGHAAASPSGFDCGRGDGASWGKSQFFGFGPFASFGPSSGPGKFGLFADRTITGNRGDNFLVGGWGDDTMRGRGGNDYLIGLYGDDVQRGGKGDDKLFGGRGDDDQRGGKGEDKLAGGRGDDTQRGGDDNDRLSGGRGDDVQRGGAGHDTIHGDRGDDRQYGGSGNDILDGGQGNDEQHGGDGNDELNGGSGNDVQHGGAGDDALNGGDGNDTQHGGAGDDTLKGYSGDDVQHGGDGGDTLYGDGGDDEQHGGAGSDLLKGDSGDDVQYGDGGDDTLHGEFGDDVQHGGAGNDTLYGEWGSDTQHGGAGDDTLDGGSEDDEMHGGDGDDMLTGGAGNDALFGGDGEDTAFYFGDFDDYEYDPDAMTLRDLRDGSPDGTDTVEQIELFQFADMLATIDDLIGGTTIMDIQGAGHRSQFEGQEVETRGIVTFLTADGFYMQDRSGDGDEATSDAIFVSAAGPMPAIGDEVNVTGLVVEQGAGNDLTLTHIDASELQVRSSANDLPTAIVIGVDRLVPTATIDDDGLTSFDPASDAIDFYESLEGMIVEVDNPLVVASTNRDGEVGLAASRGDESGPGVHNVVLSEVGGLVDYHPEVIVTDDRFVTAPNAATGDAFTSNPVGIMDYVDGAYRLQLTSTPQVVPGGNTPETTTLTEGNGAAISIAFVDANGLNPGIDDLGYEVDAGGNPIIADQLDFLADHIFDALSLPDVVVLRGLPNDGTIDILSQLQTAILIADPDFGSITYNIAALDPVGGAPGANDQIAFLYNSARVTLQAGSLQRIADPAFDDAPKPLVADFKFKFGTQEKVTVIGADLDPNDGDDSLYGATQPPVEHTLADRVDQAAAINAFVATKLASDPNAKIVVAGNLNDDQFSDTADTLANGGDAVAELVNLADIFPPDELFTFVDNGVSQAYDHFLVSDHLAATAEFDAVHTNLDFGVLPDYVGDHDSIIARIDMTDPDLFV